MKKKNVVKTKVSGQISNLFKQFKSEHNKRKKFLHLKKKFIRDKRDNSAIIFVLQYLPIYENKIEELRRVYEATVELDKISEMVIFDMILKINVSAGIVLDNLNKESDRTKQSLQELALEAASIAEDTQSDLLVEQDKVNFLSEDVKKKQRKLQHYPEIYQDIDIRIAEVSDPSNKRLLASIIESVMDEYINSGSNSYLNELYIKKNRDLKLTRRAFKKAYSMYRSRLH